MLNERPARLDNGFPGNHWCVTTLVDGALNNLEPESWSALEELGRALHLREPDLQTALDRVVEVAVATLSHANWASINLVVRGKFLPQATCGEPPHALDAFQQRTGYGPCADASRTQDVVRVDDMVAEQRWDGFSEAAVAVGVHSMLCIPLWVDDRRLGAMSLYSAQPRFFDENDERLARLFATHAALALADAQRADNMRVALHNRDAIGQAKGILMERHKLTAAAAFDQLSERSQRTNRKLVDVAEHLVSTGELP